MKILSFRLTGLAALLAMAVAGSAQANTIADWNFETNNFSTNQTEAVSQTLAADGGGSGEAWGNHASSSTVYSAPAGNGSAHSFSSNTWAQGDFYEFQVSTSGLQNIGIQFDQTSSNTGPGLYQLQYSTDGVNFSNFGSQYTVLANASPNPVWNSTTSSSIYTFADNLSSVTALNNQANVYFRLEDATSTVAAGSGSQLGTAGTDRIDNVIITAQPVPEPSGIVAILGLGAMCIPACVWQWRKRGA
ncbi:MAG: hypothetical protein ACLP9L_03615 [Thermoguttaceae bacterium]